MKKWALLAIFLALPLFAQSTPISGCSEVANVATCNSPIIVTPGQTVSIEGVTPLGYNGSFPVSAIASGSFSYILGVTGLTSSGPGTVVVVNPSTTLSNFTISASVVSLPGGGSSFPATDVGATFAVTNSFWLRSDNLVAPGPNLTANYGGVQYALPLANLLKNTNLNANSFQFYATASLGEARVPTGNHVSVLAGGGVNYSPTASGHFTTNLAEIRWAKLPGFANSTVILSSSLNWTF